MSISNLEENDLSNTPKVWGQVSNHVSRLHYKTLYAAPPNNLGSVLPTVDLWSNRISRTPSIDYIIVALNFEHLCMTERGTYPPGTPYRYHAITAAGAAYIDMRDVVHNRGKDIVPGDRGSSWFKFMTPLHYVVEEYQTHKDQGGQSQQFLFAFGKSKVIKGDDLSFRLYRLFASLRKLNRRVDEIEQGSLRQLIFVTFHSAPVEETLDRLGLKWLEESGVMMWDLKRDEQLESRFDKLAMRFEYVLESLGIRFEDTRFGNLSRSSGNATVFMIQTLLALFYRDKDQQAAFAARRPLCWLRYTWVGHTLDQMNVTTGEGPKRRDESQMNCNDVPQRRNEKAFS